MKQLFFILSAAFLFSCTPENELTPKSGPITFSIPYGDSINNEENFDTIVVSGVDSLYSMNQIRNIELDVVHPHIEDLSILLQSPDPDRACFFITDLNETGANINRVIYAADSTLYSSINYVNYNGGDPVPVNGNWVVYTVNLGSYHGYLSQFDITFNY